MAWGSLYSGGFLFGPVQMAPFRYEFQRRGYPAWSCGTSIGVFHAAMFARGEPGAARCEQEWRGIDELSDVQRLNADFWRGFYSLNPARTMLIKHRAGRDMNHPVYAGMVDVATQEHELERLDRWHHNAIIASASQPLLHEVTKYKGRYKMDGGAAMVLPPAPPNWWRSVDEVVAVFCSPITNRARIRTQAECNSALEYLQVYLEMAITRTVQDDFRRLLEMSHRAPVTVYAPDSWEQIGRNNDASHAALVNRLDVVGPWMAEHPMRLEGGKVVEGERPA